MEPTPRQKIRHLLRRFGFGSTVAELAEFEKIGLHATIDRLIEFEKVRDDFSVSPWDFVMGQDGNVNLDANRAAAWWAFRIAASKRPLQEKLTVFWHNHFAVSASKVENHPMMLQHVEMLREHAGGNFRSLLGEVTTNPAMLRWLDTDTSVLGKPNENFAREVLELFTVGIGNYTEKDIKELARALTGWSIRTIYAGGGNQARLKQFLSESIEMDRPIVASSYSAGFHDNGVKTILGKTGRFDTDTALDLLASRPQTARYITGKLWSFFAYPSPEPKLHDKLMKTYFDSKYDIKQLMLAIATSKEFYGEKAYRSAIKSPIDLVVPLVRQLRIPETALAQKPAGADAIMMSTMSAAPQAILGTAELIYSSMRRMGMRLLYPPDVAGWDWGTAWVSPAMMTERIRFATTLVSRGRTAALAEFIRIQIDQNPASDSGQLVDSLLEMFDAEFPADKRAILVESVEKSGGPAAFKRNQTAVPAIQNLFRLVFAAPEFQMF